MCEIDHHASAKDSLLSAERVQRRPNVAAMLIAVAQVHATLELAEQQKNANLIAMGANAARMVAEGTAATHEYVALIEQINPEVREGLGL
jgi:hypothetical protein